MKHDTSSKLCSFLGGVVLKFDFNLKPITMKCYEILFSSKPIVIIFVFSYSDG